METTYTYTRENLASLVDLTVNDKEIVIIKRRKNQSVALIAADELASLMETIYLLVKGTFAGGLWLYLSTLGQCLNAASTQSRKLSTHPTAAASNFSAQTTNAMVSFKSGE